MRKKYTIVAVITLIAISMLATVAFAANTSDTQNDNNNYQNFFSKMFDWHKSWVDKSLKDGKLTQEQADTWNEHFNYMQEFHSENGFGPMGSMMGSGACPGLSGQGFNGAGGMMGRGAYGAGGMMGSGFYGN